MNHLKKRLRLTSYFAIAQTYNNKRSNTITSHCHVYKPCSFFRDFPKCLPVVCSGAVNDCVVNRYFVDVDPKETFITLYVFAARFHKRFFVVLFLILSYLHSYRRPTVYLLTRVITYKKKCINK